MIVCFVFNPVTLKPIPGDLVNFDENQLNETLKWTPEAWAKTLSVLGKFSTCSFLATPHSRHWLVIAALQPTR